MNTPSDRLLLFAPVASLALLAATVSAQDLKPTDLTCSPRTFTSGQPVTLTSVIKNLAIRNRAGASSGAYYLSKDIVLSSDDTRLATFSTPGLAANATDKNSLSVRIPDGIRNRNYYILVKADFRDAVKETIETNNVRRFAVTGVAADLTQTFVAPLLIKAGDTKEFTLTVSNLGALKSEATTALFFLSSDAKVTLSDVYLGSISVPSVAGLRTVVRKKSFKLPYNSAFYAPAGKTTVGVIVNPHRTAPETNYANNAASISRPTVGIKTGRYLEWRPRYARTGIGATSATAATVQLASGVNEQLGIVAPEFPNAEYLVAWSASSTNFVADAYTLLGLDLLFTPVCANWYGTLNATGERTDLGFVLPKIGGVHGFTIYSHLYFVAKKDFGDNVISTKFVN